MRSTVGVVTCEACIPEAVYRAKCHHDGPLCPGRGRIALEESDGVSTYRFRGFIPLHRDCDCGRKNGAERRCSNPIEAKIPRTPNVLQLEVEGPQQIQGEQLEPGWGHSM